MTTPLEEFSVTTKADERDGIDSFMHCALCMRTKPTTTTARDWARLAVGVRGDGGLQIWCVRHNRNVAVLMPRRTLQ